MINMCVSSFTYLCSFQLNDDSQSELEAEEKDNETTAPPNAGEIIPDTREMKRKKKKKRRSNKQYRNTRNSEDNAEVHPYNRRSFL